MISQLSIKGFKSIRELDLSCRRVNVFIGEPNTGKTNILEALALWCPEVLREPHDVLRANQTSDLFSQQETSLETQVTWDQNQLLLKGSPEGAIVVTSRPSLAKPTLVLKYDDYLNSTMGEGFDQGRFAWPASYYLFNAKELNGGTSNRILLPPFGGNLGSLLASNKEARQTASSFFQEGRYRLKVEVGKREILMVREEDDTFIALPYIASSETLRRMVFYTLALETNKEKTLVLDEPEAHAFPPYTKRLAERIASDDQGNQFFLTTHSPYMLDSLLSKTPATDLNVVLCRMENFETKAYQLNEAQIGKLMEWSMDAFFNFDRLLDTAE